MDQAMSSNGKSHPLQLSSLSGAGEAFFAIVESLNQAVLVADERACVSYVNPRMATFLACSQADLVGQPVLDVMSTRQGWPQFRWAQKQSWANRRELCEVNLMTSEASNGRADWVEVVSMPLQYRNSSPMGTLVIVTDISHRKWVEDQLQQQSECSLERNGSYDALTGLPNRTLFVKRLEAAIARARDEPDYLFAVLFIDLDRFKLINDSLGHLAGDQVLMAMARRLEICVRPGDTVARLGGDEFTILLTDIRYTEDATIVAERIQQELSQSFDLDGNEVFSSVSIGIAINRGDSIDRLYDSPEDLLRDADIAMYHAKTSGRARHQVFTTSMYLRAVELLELESDLRRAVERQEFCIHYQPIVALDTGRISGFEALVRWYRPKRGLVFPADFIAVAEETGIITAIGEWVLHTACHQLWAWQQRFPTYPPLTISVNLSARQLTQSNLVSRIHQILEETKILPGSLKLEITESTIMKNPEATASLLEKLRQHNIQLCIDDFGTGYSSLSHLRRFPINTLKIDRSFITTMHGDEENLEIVKTIVHLAHSLGIYITAEGVERNEHLHQLWALQCEYAQGLFFSEALDSEAATALIASYPQW
ncbi:hypothetical protein BST81_16245 [Leptolyngbya sp. 'hensonii']|uniref:putative bifunctional diguanylate cyclase/phosphodiesterase n=1 Tax=Leptolyngbya sp. 'hensonii' TaxID=1922337 RepID=UPI00094FC6AF|nr:GGDEF domain-containing phosphodiesterase [Leptolyngbya sp. 'hensonii']OLP17352.1 hypothetical protein BST81_16245 [Leptolyngbya sp. 'hensonii']